MLPNIKLYYKDIIIKTAWHWHKNTCIDQWNRIHNPEINLHLYSQLTFDRGSKHIQWAKDSLFKKCRWKNWTDMCQKNETRTPSYDNTRINSKWIKDFNVRPGTLKIVEKISHKTLGNADRNYFSDISPQARKTKEKRKTNGTSSN